jgi:NADH-quinone oxidoreductase subunit F
VSRYKITVGMGSCGIAAGAKPVFEKLNNLIISSNNKDITLEETGCIGMCYKEPLVEISDRDTGEITLYGEITDEKVEKVFNQHILNNEILTDWVVKSTNKKGSEENLFKKQFRIVLSRAGNIAPESIEDYLNTEGYVGLTKSIKEMTREDVIDEIKKSGLRGRGGAGFPTGLKWQFAYNAKCNKKYIVCNADEGDPGAFMDRSVLESDPHSVLEGLTIGAYAIGANEGYIYCRAEYPLAIKRLNIAIKQAKERGYLGDNILGSDFSFHIKIKEGAGAFVCGEETALIASIEGKRGMPTIRPPFPANKGIWGKPTNINNVETLANIAWIIRNGAEKYSSLGTERSKGTKVFSLSGKIRRTGLVEVPMGITLREIIFDIGGGIKNDKKFKAIQVGGPSGGCIPESLLDTPVDYDSLNETGAIMGSGGMVIMDESTCMVGVAKYFLNFTQSESCGKCTFCRVGTKRMYEILNKITEGKANEGDLNKLENLAYMVKESSLCGLGQTAPNPVLTTLKYFRDEYEAHIKEKKCPSKECKALITYKIETEKCKSCGLCAKSCPVNAITGDKGVPYVIDQLTCMKCGNCFNVCPFGAIEVK